jgi:hypothetical protein
MKKRRPNKRMMHKGILSIKKALQEMRRQRMKSQDILPSKGTQFHLGMTAKERAKTLS